MRSTTLMTTTEAGRILGKSPRTVQRMAENGDLEYAQKLPGPNGAYLFDPAVIARRAARETAALTP